MSQAIVKWFAPPRYDDYLENRTAVSLAVILYSFAFLSLLGIFVVTFEGELYQKAIVFSFFLLTVGSIVLLKRGNLVIPSNILPALTLLLFFTLAASGKGIRDLSAFGFPAVILLAALLLGRRGGIIYALLSILAFAAMFFFERQSWISTPFAESNNFIDVLQIGITLGALAALVWVMITNLGNALERTQESERELVTLNTELEERVQFRTAELDVAKREAEEARDRALEADNIKSQYLASMSHELRTPLNAILAFNELLAMEALGPVTDEQKGYLLQSLASGKHLLSLINDVLDITKIQSDMLTLRIVPDINLKEELVTVISTAHTILNGKDVEFITEIDEPLPAVEGDKRRIRQILLNLVSNACKFTEDGSVKLSVNNQSDGNILFSVADTGPGIAPEDQTKIFKPFQQSDSGIRHAGGTGLGLPISISLVEAHGGVLWVESEPGHGAIFFVRLPVSQGVLEEAHVC